MHLVVSDQVYSLCLRIGVCLDGCGNVLAGQIVLSQCFGALGQIYGKAFGMIRVFKPRYLSRASMKRSEK